MKSNRSDGIEIISSQLLDVTFLIEIPMQLFHYNEDTRALKTAKVVQKRQSEKLQTKGPSAHITQRKTFRKSIIV